MDKENGKLKKFALAIKNNLSLNNDGRVLYSFTAKNLSEVGYGDVKQAVKEFAENKVKPLIDELVELLFNDDEPDCKVDNCEKENDIPCGCSICIEENKQVWKNKVDKLVKELYGDETD